MTLTEIKERKIKLIHLILLCNYVKVIKMKKENTLSISDAFGIANENIYWVYQLLFVSSSPIPKFEKGCVSIVGEKRKEIILRRTENKQSWK